MVPSPAGLAVSTARGGLDPSCRRGTPRTRPRRRRSIPRRAGACRVEGPDPACSGPRCRAAGNRGHVGVGEIELVDQGQAGRVILLSFTGKAGNDVGGDAGVGRPLPDGRYRLCGRCRYRSGDASPGARYHCRSATARESEGTGASLPSASTSPGRFHGLAARKRANAAGRFRPISVKQTRQIHALEIEPVGAELGARQGDFLETGGNMPLPLRRRFRREGCCVRDPSPWARCNTRRPGRSLPGF